MCREQQRSLSLKSFTFLLSVRKALWHVKLTRPIYYGHSQLGFAMQILRDTTIREYVKAGSWVLQMQRHLCNASYCLSLRLQKLLESVCKMQIFKCQPRLSIACNVFTHKRWNSGHQIERKFADHLVNRIDVCLVRRARSRASINTNRDWERYNEAGSLSMTFGLVCSPHTVNKTLYMQAIFLSGTYLHPRICIQKRHLWICMHKDSI